MKFIIRNNELVYDRESYPVAMSWRKQFSEAKYAYQQSAANKKQPTETLYFGARYAEKATDEVLFTKNNLMADLTIINPGQVGNEYLKTVGHYHGHTVSPTLSYPEVYEALTNHLEYLLQSEPDEAGRVDVIWVITEAGDKVVMPPNWGHVSLNTGSKWAIETDLQKRDNPDDSDYEPFKKHVGGAVYRTNEGLTVNPKYKVRSLRIVRPLERPDWGLTRGKALYDSFVETPDKFKWLTKPEKYDFSVDGLFADIEL